MTQELGETSKSPKGRMSPQPVSQRASRPDSYQLVWAPVRPHPADRHGPPPLSSTVNT